jgi:hypothetical protein
VGKQWAETADKRGRKGSETLAQFKEAIKDYRP